MKNTRRMINAHVTDKEHLKFRDKMNYHKIHGMGSMVGSFIKAYLKSPKELEELINQINK